MGDLSIKRPSKSQTTKEKLMQDVAGVDGNVKVNFNLPRTLLKQTKIRCAEEGRSMSQLVRELLTTYLHKST